MKHGWSPANGVLPDNVLKQVFELGPLRSLRIRFSFLEELSQILLKGVLSGTMVSVLLAYAFAAAVAAGECFIRGKMYERHSNSRSSDKLADTRDSPVAARGLVRSRFGTGGCCPASFL